AARWYGGWPGSSQGDRMPTRRTRATVVWQRLAVVGALALAAAGLLPSAPTLATAPSDPAAQTCAPRPPVGVAVAPSGQVAASAARTGTPTATAARRAPDCSNRPAVLVAVALAGSTQLQATLTAQSTAAVPGNTITALRFSPGEDMSTLQFLTPV